MADLTGISQWKLNTEEIGYMVDEDSLSQDADSYKVYVPNVLPLVEQGDALETPSPLDTSCFINDGECTITSAGTVTTANYLKIKTKDNMEFKRPILKKGAELTIGNTGDSVNTLYITNMTDQSEYSKSKSVNKNYKSYLYQSMGIDEGEVGE